MMNLDNFFKPKRIAVVGVSRNPNKVGHVILKNILDGKFPGKAYPVNPKANKILGLKCYKSVKDISGKVDLAVISVPAEFVLQVIKECNEKGIKDVLIVTAGFGEVGNRKLEDELKDFLNKNKMRAVGVNCLGIYDAYNKVDTLFLPISRLKRPKPGSISFVCQSGALGSAILDLASKENYGFSKFISYGNATQVDESDLVDYLDKDDKTKVICLYVEGVKDGDKFYETIKKVSKKKPIIVLKGGLTDRGMKATLSHTGSLAGKKEVYYGVFKQANAIRADSLEEMFHIASLIEKGVSFKNNKIQVITNGGGYGIVSTDNIVDAKNLEMVKLSNDIKKKMEKEFPKIVHVTNPLDLLGDATDERYEIALRHCMNDKNIGCVLCVALYQTPLITEKIIDIISSAHKRSKKPIVAVSTGGDFTEKLSNKLEEKGVPVFDFPQEAVRAIDKVAGYYLKKN